MQVEPLVPKKHFRWFVIGSLVLLLVGLVWTAAKSGSIKIPGETAAVNACVELPENFVRYELPAKEGCYRLKLDPKKYSGKIYLPQCALNGSFDFENPNGDDWAEALTHLSERPIRLTSMTDSDFGDVRVNARRSIFRFRGKGVLKIYLQPAKK